MGIFLETPEEKAKRSAARAAAESRPRTLSDAGGTPGGALEFLAGTAMAVVGFYLLAQRIIVTSALSDLWHRQGSPVGIALLTVLLGFGLLFWRGGSKVGWLLTLGGVAVVIVLVFLRLNVLFQPTTLWHTLLALGLLGGGLGLVANSLRDHA